MNGTAKGLWNHDIESQTKEMEEANQKLNLDLFEGSFPVSNPLSLL